MFSKRLWAITMALAVAGVVGATALPSVAQTAPIVLEQLGDRSVFTDTVELKFKVKDHDGEMTVVSTQDPSRTVAPRSSRRPSGVRSPSRRSRSGGPQGGDVLGQVFAADSEHFGRVVTCTTTTGRSVGEP